MQALRDLFTGVGYTRVQTYIQSGNVTFESRSRSARTIEATLHEELLTQHQIDASPHILTVQQWKSAILGNPFGSPEVDPKSIHVFLLKEKPSRPSLDKIAKVQGPTEKSLLSGKVFYLHTPDGFGRSKLAKQVEKLLGVTATARNWRTMQTLEAMCDDDVA